MLHEDGDGLLNLNNFLLKKEDQKPLDNDVDWASEFDLD